MEEYFKESVKVSKSLGKKKTQAKNCQVININSKKPLVDVEKFFEKMEMKPL